MDSIKYIFDKSYNFLSTFKYYIKKNKKYLPVTLIYFCFFTWLFSLFPKLILICVIEILLKSRLPIDWIENITIVVISVILLYKFIQSIQNPLEKNQEIEPLFINYPELEDEIKSMVKKHKIYKKIGFFIKNSEDLNAEAISNLYEGCIILNSSIMSLKKDEIIAVIVHEFYHIKNWSPLFINKEIWGLSIKLYNFSFSANQKANKNKITKFLALNLFTELLQLIAFICLIILNIFSCFYRVFIDEMLADKYSVDNTKSKSIANVFRRISPGEFIDDDNPFNLIINKTHLPPNFRYRLIDKYHYWKYVKPYWKLNRIIIITKAITLVIGTIILCTVSSKLIPFLLNKILFILADFWEMLFGYDEPTAMFAFIVLVSAIGSMWNGLKLYKSLRGLDSIKRRLKYGSLTCVFLCLFFGFLFILFNDRNLINLCIGLFFGLMFVILSYLYEKYDKRRD